MSQAQVNANGKKHKKSHSTGTNGNWNAKNSSKGNIKSKFDNSSSSKQNPSGDGRRKEHRFKLSDASWLQQSKTNKFIGTSAIEWSLFEHRLMDQFVIAECADLVRPL